MKIAKKILIVMMAMAIALSLCKVSTLPAYAEKTSKKSAVMSKKLYNKIKGWYTEASSAGCDYKVTRTTFDQYDRESGERIGRWKIKKVKKTRGGYFISVKKGDFKRGYFYNGKDKGFEYYDGWNMNTDLYSGSASLSAGKW